MIILNVSGNLTADAIVNHVNGTTVVNFTIASNRKYKSRGGEIRNETTYVNCQLWDNADAAKFLYKGRALSATGAFNMRKYTAKDGSEQVALNLRVSFFQLFGKNAANQMTTTTYQAAPAADVESVQDEAAFHTDLPF